MAIAEALDQGRAAFQRQAWGDPRSRLAESGLEGLESRELAAAASALGDLLATLGKTGDAERALCTAVRVYEPANGPRHPCLAEPLSALGAVRRLRGDLDEAERLYRRAVSLVGSP